MRSRKPKKRAPKKWVQSPKDHAALAASLAQQLSSAALALGKHQARAELLAPILSALKRAAESRRTPVGVGITLNATSCELVLVALAEAGFTPDLPDRAVAQDGEYVAHPVARAA